MNEGYRWSSNFSGRMCCFEWIVEQVSWKWGREQKENHKCHSTSHWNRQCSVLGKRRKHLHQLIPEHPVSDQLEGNYEITWATCFDYIVLYKKLTLERFLEQSLRYFKPRQHYFPKTYQLLKQLRGISENILNSVKEQYDISLSTMLTEILCKQVESKHNED